MKPSVYVWVCLCVFVCVCFCVWACVCLCVHVYSCTWLVCDTQERWALQTYLQHLRLVLLSLGAQSSQRFLFCSCLCWGRAARPVAGAGACTLFTRLAEAGVRGMCWRRWIRGVTKAFPSSARKSLFLKLFPWFQVGLMAVHTTYALKADTSRILWNSATGQRAVISLQVYVPVNCNKRNNK